MKKSILTLLTVGSVSMSLPIFTSCSENGANASEETSKSPKDKLEGKWKITEATGDFASMNVGTLYTFNGESFSTAAMGIETKGKIVAKNDDSFSVLFENFTDNFDYKYHFDGDKLIIEAGTQGQVFILEKQ